MSLRSPPADEPAWQAGALPRRAQRCVRVVRRGNLCLALRAHHRFARRARPRCRDSGGLIVPVIRDAQDLSIEGLGKAIKGLARKARDNQLTPDDVRGGTFTITNPGGYGTFHGTPVISQPQAAILGTYAVVKRAWVIQDELGQDVIAIRPIMNLTLTYDHRLVDGALAGRFLRDLRAKLESWGESDY